MTTIHLIVNEETGKAFGLYVNGTRKLQRPGPLKLEEIMAALDVRIERITFDAEDMQTIKILPENVSEIPITALLSEDGKTKIVEQPLSG